MPAVRGDDPAVFSLDMVVAPQHSDKKKGEPPTWPKTFAGILLSALAPSDDAPAETEIFSSGEEDWEAKAPAAEAVSIEVAIDAAATPAASDLESLGVELHSRCRFAAADWIAAARRSSKEEPRSTSPNGYGSTLPWAWRVAR